MIARAFKSLLFRKRNVYKWQTYMSGGIMFAAGIVFSAFLLTGYIKIPQIFATSSWSQTDWSSGVGSSTTNQYASASQTDATSTAGQITQTRTGGWATDYLNWSKRAPITVTNAAAIQTNYQVKLTVAYDADMKADFGDIRFTNSTGTALNYWVQSQTNSSSAIVWVKVDSLAANGDTTLYIYYGNAAATTASSGSNTFNFFDDFNDGVLDPAKWTKVDAGNKITEGNGKLQLTYGSGSGNWDRAIYTIPSFTRDDWSLEFDMKWTSDYSPYDAMMWGWKDDGGGVSYTNLIYGHYNQGDGSCTTNCLSPNYESGGAVGTNTNSWNNNTDYVIRDRMRAVGGHYYEKSVDGGANFSTTYTSTYSTQGTLHPAFMLYSGDYLIDNLRVRKWLSTEPTSSFGSESSLYPTTATLTSNIFDAGTGHDWGIVSYTATTPAGTSVSVKVRSSNASDMTGATAFASCSSIASGALASTGGCVTNNHRYVQYEVTLTGDGSATPTFSDITINMTPSDTTAPTSNASLLTLKTSPTGSTITASTYTQSGTPYLSFTAGADNGGGSGLKGYCVYLGTDSLADPATTKGMLGTSPVSTTGSTCQFIVASTSLDLSTSGYIGTALTSSTSPYYLLLKAIDNGNNIYQGAAASFAFLYDGTAPTNVAYLSTPSTIYSNVNEMVFSWPTAGGSIHT